MNFEDKEAVGEAVDPVKHEGEYNGENEERTVRRQRTTPSAFLM